MATTSGPRPIDAVPARWRGPTSVWEPYRPLIGSRAVDSVQESFVWRGRCVRYQIVAAVLMALGAAGHDHHVWIWPVPFAGGVVALAVSCACVVVMNRRYNDHYKFASIHLGMKISLRNFPPKGEAAFRDWCDRHGVDPRLGGLDGGIEDSDRPVYIYPGRLNRLDKAIWLFAAAFAAGLGGLMLYRFA